MMKFLKTFLLLTTGTLSVIGCYENYPVKRASLPSSLGVHSSLYIGQQVKVFLSEVDCVEDDSDHHYCCNISYGNFFNYLCINEGHAGSRLIEIIALQQSYPRFDKETPQKLELNAKKLINVLIEAYGKEFDIADAFSVANIDSLKRPMLIWKNDSCLVAYTFVPEALYKRMKSYYGTVLNAINSLVIISPNVRSYSEPFQVSRQYSRETLGLD